MRPNIPMLDMLIFGEIHKSVELPAHPVEQTPLFEALFGCDGSISPLGDRFCSKKGLLSFLKQSFIWDNGAEPSLLNRV